MELNILHQDSSLVLCLKPAGVESEGEGMPLLLERQLGGPIYCVHRLDQAVGGLMVFARTKQAAAALSAAVARREMEKEYLCVVPAAPEPPQGLMRDLLYRDPAKNKSFVVKRQRRGVKAAELAYILLERGPESALVRVALHTGRSHQIRVQFASRALPLLGDVKYGSRERRCGIALWSCRLAFRHPQTGKPLAFTALPPAAFPWDGFSCLSGPETMLWPE